MTPNYEAVDGSHCFGLVNYTVVGTSEQHLIHVPVPPAVCERNLSFIFNMPVFIDQENTNSTFREVRRWLLLMEIATLRAI